MSLERAMAERFLSETLHRMKLDIWGGQTITLETLREGYRVAVQWRGGDDFEVLGGEYDDDPEFQNGGVVVVERMSYTSDVKQLARFMLNKMND